MGTHGTGSQWCAFSTIGQESSILVEFWETGDSKVFLVRVFRSDEVLSLGWGASIGRKNATTSWADPLHSVQDIRFALIISVSTNSEVDLPGVFVGLESLRNTWWARVKKAGRCCDSSHAPRMGSGGPAGTFAHVDREALARFLEDTVRGREMACIILKGFFVGSGGDGVTVD